MYSGRRTAPRDRRRSARRTTPTTTGTASAARWSCRCRAGRARARACPTCAAGRSVELAERRARAQRVVRLDRRPLGRADGTRLARRYRGGPVNHVRTRAVSERSTAGARPRMSSATAWARSGVGRAHREAAASAVRSRAGCSRRRGRSSMAVVVLVDHRAQDVASAGSSDTTSSVPSKDLHHVRLPPVDLALRKAARSTANAESLPSRTVRSATISPASTGVASMELSVARCIVLSRT